MTTLKPTIQKKNQNLLYKPCVLATPLERGSGVLLKNTIFRTPLK